MNFSYYYLVVVVCCYIPSFPLELLTVAFKNTRKINLKRIGSYLYNAFKKNNMIVEARNLPFLKRCTFATFRYA